MPHELMAGKFTSVVELSVRGGGRGGVKPTQNFFSMVLLANNSSCFCRITVWVLMSFFMKPSTGLPGQRAWRHGQGSLTKT